MADKASVLTGGTNSFQTTAEHLNSQATDFISDGVVGAITNTAGVAPSTGALAVNAQGTPNMTVAVSAGICYVTATPTGQASQRLRANIAAQNATIAANSTGGTRYDWIYVKIDPTNANTPNTAGDNVASIVVSRSTSSSTDNGTPPTYGYAIAVVTVANGASSITNGNITDKRARTGANAISTAVTPAMFYNPYKFSVYRNAAWTDGNNTFAKVQFDTELFDTSNNYDNATNFRFTAPIAGFYFFTAAAGKTSTATNIVDIALYVNGLAVQYGNSEVTGAVTTGNRNVISGILSLAANDYVEVWSYGTGSAGSTGKLQTYFQGFLVSAT